MLSPNGILFQLTALLRAKYGDPSSESTPEEAEVAQKLFKIFNICIANAAIKKFDLELEVEDYLLELDDNFVAASYDQQKDADPNYMPDNKRPKLEVTETQMRAAIEAYRGAMKGKEKAAKRACRPLRNISNVTRQIVRWEAILAGKNSRVKFEVIRNHVLFLFENARRQKRAVHESDFRMWAIKKAEELSLGSFRLVLLTFTA